MPISGQTPLTLINIAKEQKITYQPLLLIEMIFVDGSTVLRLASENLDSTEGGPQYQDFDWLPRISNETLGALSSVGTNGIIQLPQIQLQLADADVFLWSNYERADGLGFKGARVVVKQVFWDADTSTFSSDEVVKFIGVCNAPTDHDDSTLTLTVSNILNLTQFNVPTARISRHCGWPFSTTKAQRIDGASNEDSPYFKCGYCPDAEGGADARGNVDPGTGQPFTSCDYTRESCIARMGNDAAPETSTHELIFTKLEADKLGRHTARFGGVTWDPPDSWRSREYTSGSWMNGVNNPNEAKYSDYFPMIYGRAFVSPPVMNVSGDANFTVFEVALTVGKVGNFNEQGAIKYVIVNDFLVPFALTASNQDLVWNWTSIGTRDGHCNRGGTWKGAGDPYGSIAVINVKVPRSVQDTGGTPNVRVLLDGPEIRTFPDASDLDNGTMVRESTTNAAWILMDLLTWSSLQLADIDVKSFADASKVCDVDVSYVDLTGTTQTHPRYQLGVSLRQRRSMSEVVNGLLASMKGILSPNAGASSTNPGKLHLAIKQTIADQQPDPIDGSNYDTPIESRTASDDFTPFFGYAAYHFDESTILRKGDRSTQSTFHITQRSILDTPNRVSIEFQDEDFSFSQDALEVVDSEAISRCGQEVTGGVVADGIINFDQGKRIIQTQFAEQFRGNPRFPNGDTLNDTGGTWMVLFDASFRASHLKVADIVLISYVKYGLVLQPFRVLSVAPSMNCERITIIAQWHEDDWYLDSYGQAPDPLLKNQRRKKLLRPPYGLCPGEEAPWDHDQVFDPTEKSFTIAEEYEAGSDGSVITSLALGTKVPVNQFSNVIGPPYVVDAEVNLGGGNLKASSIWLSLVAVDSDGLLSPNSWPLCRADVADNDSTTVPNIYWQGAVAGWRLYAGVNPNKLSLQLTGSGTPDSITLTDYRVSDDPLPDVQFDHIVTRMRRVWHSGVWGLAIGPVLDNTIKLSIDPGFDMTGYDISIIGKPDSSDPRPILDLRVASQVVDSMAQFPVTLTIADVTDLTADLGVEELDVAVCRVKPDIISDNTIGDSNFANLIDWLENSMIINSATDETPITLGFAGPHGVTSGENVLVTGVLGNSGANGKFPVTVIDATHLSLDGSVGNGDYESGGVARLAVTGMRAHARAGSEVLIIAGTGRGQHKTILDNTTTTLTIDGTWDVTPDDTSKFIVIDHQNLISAPTNPLPNTDPDKEVQLNLVVDNFLEQTMWLQLFAVAVDGTESVFTDSPGRETFIFGGTGTAIVQFDKATFNIAVIRDAEVAEDVAPHYLIRRSGTPSSCRAQAKTPPTGQDMKLDVNIFKADLSYGGSIFGVPPFPSPIIIPAGDQSIVVDDAFIPGLHFDVGDILTVDVDRVGSIIPGHEITIVIKWAVD